MRKLLLAGAALIALTALPGASSAQAVSGEASSSADQLNGASAPAPATTTTVLSADPGTPDVVVTDYPGNMAAVPPAAMNKRYPLCTSKLQDNCQNRGEGGAPGHSRALDHWPGKPASEE
jgi:hypothetical protein